MSNKTANNFFIVPPLAIEHARFYQELLRGVVSHQQLGNRLIQLAERAHAFRQFDKVKECGQILSNIPIKSYQAIGHYFLGVAANSKGNGDQDEAKRLFELVVDTTPDDYKVKSILSLGALAFNKMDFDSALFFYRETIKVGKLSEATIQAIKTINVMKALEGSHAQAVKGLETILPLIKYAPAHVYFDVLNSYALELAEVGRKDEARNIMRVVVASPFAFAYPEWQDTAKELREPNRSFVAVPQIKSEYAEIKEIVSQLASEPTKPAEVIPFKLKEAPPPQKPERLTPQEINELSLDQKRELILSEIRTTEMSEFEWNKLMVAVGLVKSGTTDKILDLEDEEILDDIAVIWANHVEPENFAAVLSALRDCDDSLRRNDIIDRMIKKAFQQTHLTRMSEEAWRLEVERRLPKK